MACFKPLQAFQTIKKNNLGKSDIVFGQPRDKVRYKEIQLPCGQCVGCRIERSRQWAIRCVHESQMHQENSFITLTFNDEHLKQRKQPKSLDVRDFQLFMKRLRKMFPNRNIRYYHCGEYGEQFGRPHYHACLFGFDFPDKVLFKDSNGIKLYTSKLLQELWPFGFSTIGDVTFESAAYVARYIMKKHLGKDAWLHYAEIDWNSGEILGQRKPEYTTMSRRPGIGKPWLDKYLADVYPDDFVVVKDKKHRPPRYYDSLYEIQYPSDFTAIKEARVIKAKKHADNNTPERLKVREKCQLAKLKSLVRPLE